MRIVVVALAAAMAGCLPAIPHKTLGVRATLPASLPPLAPCALVHAEVDENLSNGAHGWFRGAWKLAYASFLVRHPAGVVLIDASFGDRVQEDVDGAGLLFGAAFGSARAARPIAALLAEAGVRPEEVTHVLVTHAHWDHTGGVRQLPNAKVLVAGNEADWVLAADGHFVDGAMPHHLGAVRDRIERLVFDGPAYDGFASSRDVFGDGSIVAVPSVGHSPGSTSYYVNAAGPRRWLFVGDAAWVKEGIEEPVTKGRLASLLADHDRERTADTLGTLHALSVAKVADLVTSHDARTWTGIPRCSKN